ACPAAVDLPCIVEGLKTADSRTFYKVANITQMLMCGEDCRLSFAERFKTILGSASLRRRSRARRRAEEADAPVDHGLTPPLRNVRRKAVPSGVAQIAVWTMPELEKEVKRLLKTIWKAADVNPSEHPPAHRKLWTMQQQSDDGHSAVLADISDSKHPPAITRATIATNEERRRRKLEAWAQLFNTFGRRPGTRAALRSLPNRSGRRLRLFVSGHHCAVFKDPDGGVWLQDTSMNGTLVNGRRILGDVAELRQDDVITVCPLPGNSTVAFRLKLLGHEQPDEASESGSAEPPQTMMTKDKDEEAKDKANKSAVTTEKGTVSKVPTVSADAAAASASASASSSASRRSNGSQSELHNCCEIFHDCVTLIPCLHGYCAGCYSQWQRTNPVCPQCRVRPERVTKNVLVTNLAEAYLAAHPERRRPAEELEKLDSLNDIGRQEAFPVVRQSPADEDESDEEDEDSDDDGNAGVAYFGMNRLFGFAGPYPTYQLHRLATPLHLRHVCRQCPGYQPPDRACSRWRRLRAAGAGPPPVDGCPHLDDLRWGAAASCSRCCWQAFPDRRADPSLPGRESPISSAPVPALLLHAYWGCAARLPRLPGRIRDFTFGKARARDVVNGNPVESKILADYLIANNMGVRDLLESAAPAWPQASTAAAGQSGRTPLCATPAARPASENWPGLSLGPARRLPACRGGASRPNCHWAASAALSLISRSMRNGLITLAGGPIHVDIPMPYGPNPPPMPSASVLQLQHRCCRLLANQSGLAACLAAGLGSPINLLIAALLSLTALLSGMYAFAHPLRLARRLVLEPGGHLLVTSLTWCAPNSILTN
uniref:E3 ubiquitin-protein ligase CHFR n=1 Tax=Macrostomum lignano TaxID=282301 RepID=A0A1I8FKN3_9PLAT